MNPWQEPGIANFQKVLRFIEAKGPRTKGSIAHHTGVSLQALSAMISDGTIHSKGDGLLYAGRNPNYKGGPNKTAREWNREVRPARA